MKTKLMTGLIAATATLTGVLAMTGNANAYELKRAATDPGFQSVVNEFQQFVQTENSPLSHSAARTLDVTKLFLSKTQENVKAYFINEGATFQNQLGFTATGGTNASGMLFSDISCPDQACKFRDNNFDGVPDGDLHIGDYVEMGSIKGGTQLDFWLNANGVNWGDKFHYGTDADKNPDKLQHVVAYDYKASNGKNYLVVGFEDLYGPEGARGTDPATGLPYQRSDRDFNDVVFAFDIGDSIHDIPSVGVPEPSATAALLGAGLFGLVGMRRRQKGQIG